MDNPTAQCTARDRHGCCSEQPSAGSNPPLCLNHREQIAHQILIERGPSTPAALAGAVRAAVPLKGQHESVVYFLRNGDRIKIGITTNISKRVDQLSLRITDVMIILYGGKPLEAALHRHFGRYRIGTTEWFRYSDEIAYYITTMRIMTPSVPGQTTDAQAAVMLDSDILEAAAEHVTEYGIASATMLQKRMSISYARAARIISALEASGVCASLTGPGASRSVNYPPGDKAGAADAVRRFADRTIIEWDKS